LSSNQCSCGTDQGAAVYQQTDKKWAKVLLLLHAAAAAAAASVSEACLFVHRLLFQT
jgi:hypothetical protein